MMLGNQAMMLGKRALAAALSGRTTAVMQVRAVNRVPLPYPAISHLPANALVSSQWQQGEESGRRGSGDASSWGVALSRGAAGLLALGLAHLGTPIAKSAPNNAPSEGLYPDHDDVTSDECFRDFPEYKRQHDADMDILQSRGLFLDPLGDDLHPHLMKAWQRDKRTGGRQVVNQPAIKGVHHHITFNAGKYVQARNITHCHIMSFSVGQYPVRPTCIGDQVVAYGRRTSFNRCLSRALVEHSGPKYPEVSEDPWCL
jgi:hypothetical protein